MSLVWSGECLLLYSSQFLAVRLDGYQRLQSCYGLWLESSGCDAVRLGLLSSRPYAILILVPSVGGATGCSVLYFLGCGRLHGHISVK